MGRFEGDKLRLLAGLRRASLRLIYDAALSGVIFIAEVVCGTLVIRRLVILRAVYPWRNFPHALWVDFQKKSYALLCSAVARDKSTKPIRSSQVRIP